MVILDSLKFSMAFPLEKLRRRILNKVNIKSIPPKGIACIDAIR